MVIASTYQIRIHQVINPDGIVNMIRIINKTRIITFNWLCPLRYPERFFRLRMTRSLFSFKEYILSLTHFLKKP